MARAARRPAAGSDARTRKMRAVLAACRRLGLDQEARKDLQLDVIGVASMSDMSEQQLGQLLDHLNRDYQGTNPSRPHVAKIKALWWSLYWIGAIDEPSDKALSAFVKGQTGIASIRFLDHRHAYSVIEALKSWLAREGVRWLTDAQIQHQAVTWPARSHWSHAEWDRWSVIYAIHKRLFDIGQVNGPPEPYAAAALGIGMPHSGWSPRQLDEVIRLFGKKWRAAKP